MFRRNKDDDATQKDTDDQANLRLGLTDAKGAEGGKKARGGETGKSAKTDGGGSAPLKPFARKGKRAPSAPSVAAVQSTYRTPSGTEIPRRPVDKGRVPSRVTRAGSSARDNDDGGKRLTVGRDICLTGEISACDTLVVQGRVEAHLSKARVIEVAGSGVFRGQVEVEDADISGLCDGELTVTGTLIVREGGRIVGKTRYGTLIVEAGGRISGTMEALESDDASQDSEVETDDNG